MKTFLIGLLENSIVALLSQIQEEENYNSRILFEINKYVKIINIINRIHPVHERLLNNIWEDIRTYHAKRQKGKLNFYIVHPAKGS